MLRKALSLVWAAVIVVVAFALALSIIDKGFTGTFQSILLYLSP